MGAETIAYIALAAGAVASIDAADKQRSASHRSQDAQRKIAEVQRASNAEEAAKERRQQIREERVRRARVIQSSVNTGTNASSGEEGALGSLSTQLGSNIGFNLGKQMFGTEISIFSQQDANARGDLNNAQLQAQLGQMLFSAGMGFSGGGGKAATTG